MLFGDGSVPQMVGQSFVGMRSDVLYMLHAGEVLTRDGHADARLSVLPFYLYLQSVFFPTVCTSKGYIYII